MMTLFQKGIPSLKRKKCFRSNQSILFKIDSTEKGDGEGAGARLGKHENDRADA